MAIKIQGESQEVCSPKKTKNTPQIITEERKGPEESGSDRARGRCCHRVGIQNEESTQRKEQLKQTKQTPKRERKRKKTASGLGDGLS